jgi:hypothetical protein
MWMKGGLYWSNPNTPHRVRTPRPKNSATNAIESPKLSISEHKQNEIIDASTSTPIETSSSTDTDYDVAKISQLRRNTNKLHHHQHRQPGLQSQVLIIRLHYLIIWIKCKITILWPLSFGYRYERSWDIIPIFPKKEHAGDQIWFSGILDKSTGQVISATVGRILS